MRRSTSQFRLVEVDDGLRHRLVGFDGLGVRLEIALRCNKRNQFLSDIDIGTFEGAGTDRSHHSEKAKILFTQALIIS